jgi:hypothetical protein
LGQRCGALAGYEALAAVINHSAPPAPPSPLAAIVHKEDYQNEYYRPPSVLAGRNHFSRSLSNISLPPESTFFLSFCRTRGSGQKKLNRLVCQLSAPDELDFTGAQNPPPNIYQPGGWAHSNKVIY